MEKTAFIFFELLTTFLFIACFWHAARQKNNKVLELIFALIFGVFLEWMTIQQLEAYHYGDFFLMLDGAPICIGLGWAVIIYSGMEFVKHLEMPDYARPFLVGMLALNLDLAMDAIAIGLGCPGEISGRGISLWCPIADLYTGSGIYTNNEVLSGCAICIHYSHF